MRILFLSMISAALFFASCKSETGSFKTSNNFEYTVHEKGSGEKAKVGDYVLFTYQIFGDEELKQSALDPDAPGILKIEDAETAKTQKNYFNEIMANAQAGDSISLFIPTDSIGNPMLTAQGIKMMIYTMRITKILDEAGYQGFIAEREKESQAKAAEKLKMLPDVQAAVEKFIADKKTNTLEGAETLENGLIIKKIAEGSGAMGEEGKTATVEYYGALEDGKKFDTSIERGDSFSFPIGQKQVIEGWDITLTKLKEGDKAVVWIPSELGYGENPAGEIPPGSPLIFYIEVISIK